MHNVDFWTEFHDFLAKIFTKHRIKEEFDA